MEVGPFSSALWLLKSDKPWICGNARSSAKTKLGCNSTGKCQYGSFTIKHAGKWTCHSLSHISQVRGRKQHVHFVLCKCGRLAAEPRFTATSAEDCAVHQCYSFTPPFTGSEDRNQFLFSSKSKHSTGVQVILSLPRFAREEICKQKFQQSENGVTTDRWKASSHIT